MTDRQTDRQTTLLCLVCSNRPHLGSTVGYWTTHGYANSRIANSRTGHLADWSTRVLDNSRTGQVADWTTRGCHRRLCVLSFRSFGGVCESASCPVPDLSSPRVDQSASCPVREWAIRELAYPRVAQCCDESGRMSTAVVS